MSAISRRAFFKKAGTDAAVAGFLAASGVAVLNANPLGLPIGSQTYPHRQLIKDGNFAGLLKTLKDIGVERVELCSAIGYTDFASLSDGKQVKKILSDHGLKCESAHFSMKELRETQDKSIAWAKEIGMTQMVTATLGAGSNPTMDDVKKAADEYNLNATPPPPPEPPAGQPARGGGGRGRGRGVQTSVGKGSIDWVKTFQAAKVGGVKNYFVEQNMDLTKASVAALKAMNV